MCGIAGFFGTKNIKKSVLNRTLLSLKERGPDNQNYKHFLIDKKKEKKAILLNSRLSIIDLNKRSHQPLTKHNLSITFNGEIYNYRNLKKSLKLRGYKFKTNSDTEVILSGYNCLGLNFFKMMKGMWALAIFDKSKDEIILSRDRFGEKPLYYFKDNKNLYFGSQINQLRILSEKKFKINDTQIFNYLCLGYRSLDKFGNDFFMNVKKVEQGSTIIFKSNKYKKVKYWDLNYRPNKRINRSNVVQLTRNLVIEAVKRNTVADVPISILLSGGVDSNIILSVVTKILGKKVATFSIIDRDKRYNETNLIDASVKNHKVKNFKINLKKIKADKLIRDLEKYVNHNSKPLYTITSYVSSKLHKLIKKKKFKVSLTGAGADELFAGYYDHGLHFLKQLNHSSSFKHELEMWKKNILKHVRNPHFRNFRKFIKSNYYTDYIFSNPENLKKMIWSKKYSKFKDKKYTNDNLRNRMLNEIYFETIPPILNEDDQNHMLSSVENRSPFLDADLANFSFTIPTNLLIKNAQNKYILREAFKDILPKKIFNNKIKMGFNASIDSIVIRDKKSFLKIFPNKERKIYNYIDFKKLKELYSKKKLTNAESMFLFRVINCSIFLERFA